MNDYDYNLYNELRESATYFVKNGGSAKSAIQSLLMAVDYIMEYQLEEKSE